jgi:serine/threonine-protein kinase
MEPTNADSIAELLGELRKSGIFSGEEFAHWSEELSSGMWTRESAASHLLEKGALSPYQVEELRHGRLEECFLADRYRVVDRIGAGGMGVVLRAVDTRLDRVVAVKLLPRERVPDAGAIARFEREARALAKLSHPGIVQAFDAAADRDRHFLVMEYVDGRSLASILDERGSLPAGAAASYVHQAALALAHAHSRGLIHRDLKPANLLVKPSGEVKLLDLGLARFLQDQIAGDALTLEGMGLGTPDYMAPEQFRAARSADERSDVYALGCTLYHALSGRVPFPGSSLEEKARGHASGEPAPIEEIAPDCPMGLVLVARRMMAKRSEDRFQSAREAAEALAPYVAGSSCAAVAIRSEASWRGSQLAISLAPPPSRGRRAARVAAALAAAGLVLAALSYAIHRYTSDGGTARIPREAGGRQVLVVAADGSGDHKTIGEALLAASPGATIRVRAGTYRESVAVSRRSTQAGLTIEADGAASIEVPAGALAGISVSSVERVTLRGLRVAGATGKTALVRVLGRSPGARLEDLSLEQAGGGVDLRVELEEDEAPVVVTRCRIRGITQIAIQCAGVVGSSGDSVSPCRRVVIRDNLIDGAPLGIHVSGAVRSVQVTGNRILGATLAGVQLALLDESAEDILVANNTTFECEAGFRYWAGAVAGRRVEVAGNLFLGTGSRPDALYIDSGGTVHDVRGPGDGRLLLEAWSFHHNGREVVPPAEDDSVAPAFVPPAPTDVAGERLAVISRDPASEDFLRPEAGSPLALGGAGGVDATLPAFIGAVPPAGAAPHDWEATWSARHPKMVLTVSAAEDGGGEHRTIMEALKNVRPGGTIRVVDGATYREDILLTREMYRGVTVEAVNGATLESPSRTAVRIGDVSGVTLRGFRIRPLKGMYAVLIYGRAPGTVIEDLRFEPGDGATHVYEGIGLERLLHEEGSLPVIVRRCAIERASAAFRLSGVANDYTTPQRSGGVLIYDNSIEESLFGIKALGEVHDLLVAGNRVAGSTLGGLQLECILDGSRRIALVNNTLLSCRSAIRLWDDAVKGEEIEVRANLILGSSAPDCVFIDSGGDPQTIKGPGDGAAILARWRWGRNWREGKAPRGADVFEKSWIPVAQDDTLLEEIPILSRHPKDERTYLRPAATSPLAAGGGGADDPTLPVYAGALPPVGAEPWDWSKAWTERARRRAEPAPEPLPE